MILIACATTVRSGFAARSAVSRARARGSDASRRPSARAAQGARCVCSRRGATSPRNDEEALSAESQRKPPLHGLEATSRPRQGLALLNAERL